MCSDNFKNLEEQLQPDSFHLRAGVKAELDRQFLQVMVTRPAGMTKSDFIKKAVVEWGAELLTKSSQENHAAESLYFNRIKDLETLVRELELMIKDGISSQGGLPKDVKDPILIDAKKRQETEERVRALTNAF